MNKLFMISVFERTSLKFNSFLLLLILGPIQLSCSSSSFQEQALEDNTEEPFVCVNQEDYNFNNEKGCDGKTYPDPKSSPYVIPFPSGTSFKTGLTNCSSSYHGSEYPDRYAFDFDVDEGTNFYAARGGTIVYVQEDQSSSGGGASNWVVVGHGDNTYGVYLHSPEDGIFVHKGATVTKGQLLGVTGKSGLAGYPHLHFIVVQNGYRWPYDPIPITFSNIIPADVIMKSYSNYQACEY